MPRQVSSSRQPRASRRRARDGAAGEEVARRHVAAVARVVSQHLREGPVQIGRRGRGSSRSAGMPRARICARSRATLRRRCRPPPRARSVSSVRYGSGAGSPSGARAREQCETARAPRASPPRATPSSRSSSPGTDRAAGTPTLWMSRADQSLTRHRPKSARLGAADGHRLAQRISARRRSTRPPSRSRASGSGRTRGVGALRLDLPVRPSHRRAARDDRRRAPVIADRHPLVVRAAADCRAGTCSRHSWRGGSTRRNRCNRRSWRARASRPEPSARVFGRRAGGWHARRGSPRRATRSPGDEARQRWPAPSAMSPLSDGAAQASAAASARPVKRPSSWAAVMSRISSADGDADAGRLVIVGAAAEDAERQVLNGKSVAPRADSTHVLSRRIVCLVH